MRFLLTAFLLIGGTVSADYMVTVEYFMNGAVMQQKWKITVFRQNTHTTIALTNFEGRTCIRDIDHNDYAALVEKLTHYGIWNAQSFRPSTSKNDFYRITVREAGHENSFELEAGVPLAGRNLRSMDIIRAVTSAAHRVSQD